MDHNKFELNLFFMISVIMVQNRLESALAYLAYFMDDLDT